MIVLLPTPFESHFSEWFDSPYFLACIALALASLLALRMFPVIIYLCQHKNLMDEPDARKIHLSRIPNLGGVGMYVAFMISLTALGCIAGRVVTDMRGLLALLCGVTILFFLGTKDDIIGLSPKKKFIGQVAAALVVIVLADLRIRSLEGLLGLGTLPYALSVLFTLFVFLLLINAYNLVDGIDGLAGAIAVSCSLCFGVFFLLNNDPINLLVACILTGVVLGFLKFNLSESEKLFMGDSGTLFIGFALACQAIAFLGLNHSETAIYNVPNAPVLVLAVLSFPLLDTLRVFLLRILEGRSPFSADRNHIHHRLLEIGLSHIQATLLVVFFNILTIVTALYIGDLNINLQLLLLAALVPLLYFIPFLVHRAGNTDVRAGQLRFAGEPSGNAKATGFEPSGIESDDAGPRVIVLDAYRKMHGKKTVTNEKPETVKEEDSRMQVIFKKRLEAFRKMTTTNQ